jgi:hypothetical protein
MLLNLGKTGQADGAIPENLSTLIALHLICRAVSGFPHDVDVDFTRIVTDPKTVFACVPASI